MAKGSIPKELAVFRRGVLPVLQGGNYFVKLAVLKFVADSFRLWGRRRKGPVIQIDFQPLPIFFAGVALNGAVDQPAPVPGRNRVAEFRLEIRQAVFPRLGGRRVPSIAAPAPAPVLFAI